jgi:hypothetical protein
METPMALPAPQRVYDAAYAREVAEEYLIDSVGDLLEAGIPQLASDGSWAVPILLSNARHGTLGEIGTMRVDGETGEVVFTEEDCARVKARARELADASSL